VIAILLAVVCFAAPPVVLDRVSGTFLPEQRIPVGSDLSRERIKDALGYQYQNSDLFYMLLSKMDGSVAGRLYMLVGLAPALFLAHPLLGSGYHSLWFLDNCWSLAAVEMGILGVVLLVVLHRRALRFVRRLENAADSPSASAVGHGLFLVGVFIFFMAMAGNALFLPEVVMLLGILCGAAHAFLREPGPDSPDHRLSPEVTR